MIHTLAELRGWYWSQQTFKIHLAFNNVCSSRVLLKSSSFIFIQIYITLLSWVTWSCQRLGLSPTRHYFNSVSNRDKVHGSHQEVQWSWFKKGLRGCEGEILRRELLKSLHFSVTSVRRVTTSLPQRHNLTSPPRSWPEHQS